MFEVEHGESVSESVSERIGAYRMQKDLLSKRGEAILKEVRYRSINRDREKAIRRY